MAQQTLADSGKRTVIDSIDLIDSNILGWGGPTDGARRQKPNGRVGSRHDPGTEAGSADTGNSAPSTTFARIALAGNHDADGTITSSAY